MKGALAGSHARGQGHLVQFRAIATAPGQDDTYDGLLFRINELEVKQHSASGTPLWINHGEDDDGHGGKVDRGQVGWITGARMTSANRLEIDCVIDRSMPYGVEAARRMRSGDLGAVSLGTDAMKMVDSDKGKMRILDKSIKEVSLVKIPDQEGTRVVTIAEESAEWKLRLRTAKKLLLSELAAAAAKTSDSSTFSIPQNVSNENGAHDNNTTVKQHGVMSLAAAAAAEAEVSVPSPAPAPAQAPAATESAPTPGVGADLSEIEAMRRALEAERELVKEHMIRAATAEMKAKAAEDAAQKGASVAVMPPEVEAIVEEHRRQLAAKAAAMEKSAPDLVAKVAADLKSAGKPEMSHKLRTQLMELANDPDRNDDLFTYIATAAGATSSNSLTKLEVEYQQSKLQFEKDTQAAEARIAAEKMQKMQVEQQLLEMKKQFEKRQEFFKLTVMSVATSVASWSTLTV